LRAFLKILIVMGVSMLTPITSFAQHWKAAGDSCSIGDVIVLLTDTVSNRVYCSGNYGAPGCPHYSPGITQSACYGFSYWDGTTWTSIGDTLPAQNDHRPLFIYKDTLLSSFFYFNYTEQNSGTSYDRTAKWTGSSWERVISDSTDGIISKFELINGKLYAAGFFNVIGGVKACNVAYKDSLGWHAVDTTTWKYNYGLVDIEEYNGGIYVCGNFNNADGTIYRMAKWDGTHWSNVGGTMFNHSFDGAEVLCTYKGYLYAGGYFTPTMGDPGWNIARWNDTIWEQLGSGITDSSLTAGQVQDMKIINGKLVIAGGFNFANGISANNMVEWDGNHFCSFGGAFDNNIYGIAGYGNEIMITGPWHVYDESINDTIYNCNSTFLWTGGNYRESCSADVISSITSYQIHTGLVVYPNPASGIVSLQVKGITDYRNAAISVQNTLGEIVRKQPFSNNIDISNLTQGCYFIQITFLDKEVLKAKFIKE
jgi:hypothetical protein